MPKCARRGVCRGSFDCQRTSRAVSRTCSALLTPTTSESILEADIEPRYATSQNYKTSVWRRFLLPELSFRGLGERQLTIDSNSHCTLPGIESGRFKGVSPAGRLL